MSRQKDYNKDKQSKWGVLYGISSQRKNELASKADLW